MHCRYANIIVWYTLQTFFLVFLYLYFVWICQVRNRVIQTEGYAILCETFLSKSCTNMVVKDLNRFLHLHEIVEGLYFHCSLSVCVCLCLSVCPALLVNKIPPERMHRFGHGFRYTMAYCSGSDRIEIGDPGLKVKVTLTQYPIFFMILC